MPSNDLALLEKKIIRPFVQDGLVETVLGLAAIWLGLSSAFKYGEWIFSVSSLIFIGVVILAGRAWKHKITYPRLGFVQFKEVRHPFRKSFLVTFLVTLLVGILGGYLGHLFSNAGRADLAWHTDSSRVREVSWIFAALVFVAAAHQRIVTACVLVVLIAFLPLLALYSGLNDSYSYILIALVAFTLGALKLRKFLRDNPVITGDENAA